MLSKAIALAGTLAALAAGAEPAGAEQIQEDGVRIAVAGALTPTRLPRHGTAPISVRVGGRISQTAKGPAPQLRSFSFAFNRAGRLDLAGLPRCRLGRIDPSTTREALLACRAALVGEGTFSADVRLPEQSPFPSEGKLLAFNGVFRGRPTIFAHIYGTRPVPTSYVLPLAISHRRGEFATAFSASLPEVTGEWGFVTGISLELGRTYSVHGRRRSLLSASCPAPGASRAPFPLLRASFDFAAGQSLTTTLNRSCEAES